MPKPCVILFNSSKMKLNLPSPIQAIQAESLIEAGIHLYIKRDDLIHKAVSGNKWRKLKYNLAEAQKNDKSTILTYGGAFSNHIYSVAAAGKVLDFPTIGIIRGEENNGSNPTLSFARSCGMKLYFVSRNDYRDKTKALELIDESLDDCYVLPEGGTNGFALPGCGEIVEEVRQQWKGSLPDYWCLSCGTGGTMAGILTKINQEDGTVLGFSALKGDFHQNDIQRLLEKNEWSISDDWSIQTDYHFGGYARHQPALIDFINDFKRQHQIQLDPIYTGKLFYGIFDLVKKGYFKRGTKILAIHTGGLQGIAGFNERFNGILQ